MFQNFYKLNNFMSDCTLVKMCDKLKQKSKTVPNHILLYFYLNKKLNIFNKCYYVYYLFFFSDFCNYIIQIIKKVNNYVGERPSWNVKLCALSISFCISIASCLYFSPISRFFSTPSPFVYI